MEVIIGTSLAVPMLVLVAWRGYKRFHNGILWLGFVPAFSTIHALVGLYMLALSFQYEAGPADDIPLYASILGPSYIGVWMYGIPLEVIGFPDVIAYSAAFWLNAVTIALIISIVVQWIWIKRSL